MFERLRMVLMSAAAAGGRRRRRRRWAYNTHKSAPTRYTTVDNKEEEGKAVHKESHGIKTDSWFTFTKRLSVLGLTCTPDKNSELLSSLNM
jgi:hypothetical protein